MTSENDKGDNVGEAVHQSGEESPYASTDTVSRKGPTQLTGRKRGLRPGLQRDEVRYFGKFLIAYLLAFYRQRVTPKIIVNVCIPTCR